MSRGTNCVTPFYLYYQESSTTSIPFRVDSDGYVVVYTDGACSGNGTGGKNVKAGIGVWFNDGHPL